LRLRVSACSLTPDKFDNHFTALDSLARGATLEVNRRLYMNEDTLERTAGYNRLKRDLDTLVGAIAAYARDQLTAAAAD